MSDPPPAGEPPESRPGNGPGAARDPSRPRGATPPPLAQRLGFRLSSLFAVALLPLGVVSLVQAAQWLDAARRQEAAALTGETLLAASREARLIHEAQGAASALAQTVGAVLGDEGACDHAMSQIRGVSPQYSLVAYIPNDGRMRCASDGAAFDFAGIPLFERIVEGRAPALTVNPRGPVSGVSVIGVLHPVIGPGGRITGFVNLSMPHSALAPMRSAVRPPDPADDAAADVLEEAPGRRADDPSAPDLVTVNAEGVVLTASRGLARADEVLPVGVVLSELAGGEGSRSFTGITTEGEERFYSVVPLIEGELYALGSIPARQAVVVGPAAVAPSLVAALMWAGSLLVAWFAAERLVTRYIRRLSRAIRSFAQGSRMVGDLDMARAPAEIRDAGDAFVRMTDAILHDEAELENIVHQKEVLLREVHHRVKNNLQLIASIMSMQMRRARSPETRALMQGLQERVMSLATVHKELYQTTGLADVRADELLGDITAEIVRMASAPGRRFQVAADFAPIRLVPDQAVPLSLLLTEGLTNAIKYAAAPPGERLPRLDLGLAAAGPGRAELSIVNSTGRQTATSEADTADGTGLGSQLIAAFAAQLGGEVRREAAGDAYALRIAFALADLEGGEERHAPGASSPAGPA